MTEKIEEIAAQIDGLPLALDQASAYIEETGVISDKNQYQIRG
jgi:hypothetical protein